MFVSSYASSHTTKPSQINPITFGNILIAISLLSIYCISRKFRWSSFSSHWLDERSHAWALFWWVVQSLERRPMHWRPNALSVYALMCMGTWYSNKTRVWKSPMRWAVYPSEWWGWYTGTITKTTCLHTFINGHIIEHAIIIFHCTHAQPHMGQRWLFCVEAYKCFWHGTCDDLWWSDCSLLHLKPSSWKTVSYALTTQIKS